MELSKKEMCAKYPPCGGWCISNCAFIQIHCIEHGLDDFLYCSLVYDMETPPKCYKLKIYSTANDRNYILFRGIRYHLDEAMRF